MLSNPKSTTTLLEKKHARPFLVKVNQYRRRQPQVQVLAVSVHLRDGGQDVEPGQLVIAPGAFVVRWNRFGLGSWVFRGGRLRGRQWAEEGAEDDAEKDDGAYDEERTRPLKVVNEPSVKVINYILLR